MSVNPVPPAWTLRPRLKRWELKDRLGRLVGRVHAKPRPTWSCGASYEFWYGVYEGRLLRGDRLLVGASGGSDSVEGAKQMIVAARAAYCQATGKR